MDQPILKWTREHGTLVAHVGNARFQVEKWEGRADGPYAGRKEWYALLIGADGEGATNLYATITIGRAFQTQRDAKAACQQFHTDNLAAKAQWEASRR